jgi:chromosome segregation ATPase
MVRENDIDALHRALQEATERKRKAHEELDETWNTLQIVRNKNQGLIDEITIFSHFLDTEIKRAHRSARIAKKKHDGVMEKQYANKIKKLQKQMKTANKEWRTLVDENKTTASRYSAALETFRKAKAEYKTIEKQVNAGSPDITIHLPPQ